MDKQSQFYEIDSIKLLVLKLEKQANKTDIEEKLLEASKAKLKKIGANEIVLK